MRGILGINRNWEKFCSVLGEMWNTAEAEYVCMCWKGKDGRWNIKPTRNEKMKGDENKVA